MNSTAQQIRSFWDDRAVTYGSHAKATLGDTALRLVEINATCRQLRTLKPQTVLDVGCGNGYSTLHAARLFPNCQFTGVDYSQAMIDQADPGSLTNVSFAVADVTEPSSLPEGRFDVIYTQRLIQNLLEWDLQVAAINDLRSRLNPGGKLLLVECSLDGVESLNHVRTRLGMKPMDDIVPWHNKFLRDQKMIREFHARVSYISSTYTFLTKVVHPRLSRIAWRLPAVGRFGYNNLYIIDA